jgi:hypothetical protein
MHILFYIYIYIYKNVFLSCFKKNTRIIQRVSKLVYDYSLKLGLHFKNTKKNYFVSFNIWDYELIRKTYS